MATTLAGALRRMRPRDPGEAHRASTPLELFFDLVFVVAVSLAAVELAHELEEGHVGEGVVRYGLVFFAIWWAWMNFTWFASAYDTDDVPYRLLTILQMAGVLVLAAGVPRAIGADEDFTLLVIGYVIMRLAMVSQWLRAAAADPERRTTAHRYAAGIAVVQVLWVARLLLPDELQLVSFLVLAACELAVPAVAERAGQTPFHRGHIAERYGLFTIIVLGETILASANAIVAAIDEGDHVVALVALAAAGLAVVSGMWWLYFIRSAERDITGIRSALSWGYGHYLLFAAAGAVSAGVEVMVVSIAGETELSDAVAAACLTVPVGLFLATLWWLSLRRIGDARLDATLLGGAVLVGASAVLGHAGLYVGAALVVAMVVIAQRGAGRAPGVTHVARFDA